MKSLIIIFLQFILIYINFQEVSLNQTSGQLNNMEENRISGLSEIDHVPANPVELFNAIKDRAKDKFVAMNLATLDDEFGVLDRTVVFRGFTDNYVTFVTERNTRKYFNLKQNPTSAVTIFFPNLVTQSGDFENWQIRLFKAEAIELNDTQIASLWQQEPLFAKIRSHICECGKPSNREALKSMHDQLLNDHLKHNKTLEQTPTYTAFKIVAKYWDFYKSRANEIADRVQYRLKDDGTWETLHVDP